MDVAVIRSALADLQNLFLGDAAALAGLYQVVGKIAEADAAVVLDFAGALTVQAAGIAAGTVANRELTIIFVQPVGDVLDGDRLVLGGDGALHRDDVHADAVSSGRDQMGLAFERQEGHFVEAIRQLGVFLHLLEYHVGHLSNTGNEELDVPLFLVLGILPVVLHDAVIGGVRQQFNDAVLTLAGDLCNFSSGLGLAQAHFQHDLCDLIAGTCAIQNDVFRVFLCQSLDAELVRETVGDHFAEVKQNLSCHIVAPFHI